MKIIDLKLQGVRGFEELELDFKNPITKEPLKNVVLVGKNGSGKTTILKSIVHCLTTWNYHFGGQKMDETDINIKSDEFSIKLNVKFNELEKQILFKDVDTSKIEKINTITATKKNETIKTKLDNQASEYIDTEEEIVYKDYILITPNTSAQEYNNFRKNVFSNENNETLVFYFDSLRFLSTESLSGPNSIELPQNKREDMLSDSVEFFNGNPLFKYNYVKQWLINLDFKRLKNSEYESIYNRVINAIDLLITPNKFDSITEKSEILFKTRNGEIPIEKLSDGFKNVFIIIGEILFRFEQNTEVDNINEMFNKEAIVMIDEIDCHLHPEWQLNIIPTLNKIFPNIQIIATTHSPFIIQNLQTYEVIKLEEDKNEN